MFYTASRDSVLLHSTSMTLIFTQCTYTFAYTGVAFQDFSSRTIYSTPSGGDSKVENYNFATVTLGVGTCSVESSYFFYVGSQPGWFSESSGVATLTVPGGESSSFGV